MLCQKNWDKVKERLLAIWENEIIDRCCISVTAKIDRNKPWGMGKPAVTDEEIYNTYIDKETVRGNWEAQFSNTYFAGDSFPVIWSNFGTAGHAKYFKGAQYHWGKDTVWFDPSLTDDELDPGKLIFDPESPILKKELDTVSYLSEAGMGKYFVSLPDNCGCIDALAHLRGSAQLMYDMMDSPDEVKECIRKIVDAWKTTTKQFCDAIYKNNENGCCHGWMNSWSPCTHQQLQVDFSVMISPDMYEEFALPELIATSESLGHAIYHLDGQEQIRHLDYILSVPNIRMIQWTPVAGQPRTSTHLDALRRIQKSGRGLVLFPEVDEVETLLTELSSKGLMLIVKGAKTPEEADALVKMAEKLTHE